MRTMQDYLKPEFYQPDLDIQAVTKIVNFPLDGIHYDDPDYRIETSMGGVKGKSRSANLQVRIIPQKSRFELVDILNDKQARRLNQILHMALEQYEGFALNAATLEKAQLSARRAIQYYFYLRRIHIQVM